LTGSASPTPSFARKITELAREAASDLLFKHSSRGRWKDADPQLSIALVRIRLDFVVDGVIGKGGRE
jgi:hypothetical protein